MNQESGWSEASFLPKPLKWQDSGLAIRVIEDTLRCRKTNLPLFQDDQDAKAREPRFLPLSLVLGSSFLDEIIPRGFHLRGQRMERYRHLLQSHVLREMVETGQMELPFKSADYLVEFDGMWKKYANDPAMYQKLAGCLQEIDNLVLQNSKAGRLLKREEAFEKEVLKYFGADASRTTPPSDVESEVCPMREPKSIEQAIDLVKEAHNATLTTLDRYQTQARYWHVYGGYGRPYSLMKQDGYFASLLTPQQLLQGRVLISDWNDDGRKALWKIVSEHTLNLKKKDDPIEAMEGWDPSLQDQICRAADALQIIDPRSVKHFQEQVDYEDKMIQFLEGLSAGENLPLLESKNDLGDLLDTSRKLAGMTVQTFHDQDPAGFRGGTNYLRLFLVQPDVVAKFPWLRPDLVNEGNKIFASIIDLKKMASRRAFAKTWGIELGGFYPDLALSQIEQTEHEILHVALIDECQQKSTTVFLTNPRVTELYESQLDFIDRFSSSL